MKNIKCFFVISFVFFCSLPFCFSQENVAGKLVIDGLVYGYNHDPSKKFLQKEKQIILEGILEGVSITITENGKSIYTTRTNRKGEFLWKIDLGKVYKVELAKPGYAKNILIIDVKSVPANIGANGIRFSGAELILNSFHSKDTSQINIPFGKLFFNPRTKFMDFEANTQIKKKGLLGRQDETNTHVSLMKRAVYKNKNIISPPKALIPKNRKEKGSLVDSVIPQINTAINTFNSKFKLTPSAGIEYLSPINLAIRESEINSAREALDQDKLNSSTLQDSLLINEREALLSSAIQELSLAKMVIELQKKDISIQRKLLFFAICFMLLLIGFLLLIYKHYREKRKMNILLNEKNKKITDSINYASRIQRSILLPENEIKKLLPQSFIYYEPRDIVSGDFYWFAEVEEGRISNEPIEKNPELHQSSESKVIIIAAVDCTGHGVSGAFMSLVGNSLLNEIINEKHIIQPASILKLLHNGVLKALHQNEDDALSQDGMEMSICLIDLEKKYIEFAGAMNPIYVVKDNNVTIIKPDAHAIGGKSLGARKNTEVEFTKQIIPIEKNMSVYMFTDGFADQFGGLENKKFNTPQFKNLLLDIQSMDMGMQKLAIEVSIKKWKGDLKQTDDMLVIGMKF
ncbi:MAG: SpoIIE family protein phosphatase [Bacteroidota bacterium]